MTNENEDQDITESENNEHNNGQKHAVHKHNAQKHHEHAHEHAHHTSKKESSNSTNILFGVVILLLVVIVGLVIYIFATGKNDQITSGNTTTNTAATTTTAGNLSGLSVTIITDKRCAECDVSPILPQLEQALGVTLNTKILDYSTAEGKKLYQETGVVLLPAILFDSKVTSTTGYSQVQKFLEPKSSYLSLKIGAAFNPTKEICDNNADDTNDGKVDCADDDCKDSLACRPEIKKDLQVFIMSDCPYGKEAIKGLKPVLDNFGNDLTYSIHYIASETSPGVFNSLHGSYEVDENIIQLCVNKHSSKTMHFDYLYCRSVAGIRGIDWKTCAKSTGVDIDAVQTCFDGAEGKNLLSEDIKIAEALQVSGSPTWFTNNRYQFGGFAPDLIKSNFCKYNSELAGCANVLDSTTGPVSGSCG